MRCEIRMTLEWLGMFGVQVETINLLIRWNKDLNGEGYGTVFRQACYYNEMLSESLERTL